MKHTADAICLLCQEKLSQANSYLQEWFDKVKKSYPDIHISWSFRDQASQDEAFATGHSKFKWPTSSHNAMVGGKPCAAALDLFQLDLDGRAVFNPIFYTKLSEQCVKDQDEIIWGGHFRSISDLDHFQYNPSQSS